MENNLNEMLGISPVTNIQEEKVTGNGAEKTLKVFANIILVLGILASIILLLGGIAMVANYEPETGWPMIIAVLPVLFGSLVQWAFITVFCNISNNLREINRKMK